MATMCELCLFSLSSGLDFGAEPNLELAGFLAMMVLGKCPGVQL